MDDDDSDSGADPDGPADQDAGAEVMKKTGAEMANSRDCKTGAEMANSRDCKTGAEAANSRDCEAASSRDCIDTAKPSLTIHAAAEEPQPQRRTKRLRRTPLLYTPAATMSVTAKDTLSII